MAKHGFVSFRSIGLSSFEQLDLLRSHFRFPGMAVVMSNGPIFHADGGSWLTRRILMLAFDHKPPSDKVRDLEAEFEPELSAFTNYLLSIPNDEITRVLRRIGKDGVALHCGKPKSALIQLLLGSTSG